MKRSPWSATYQREHEALLRHASITAHFRCRRVTSDLRDTCASLVTHDMNVRTRVVVRLSARRLLTWGGNVHYIYIHLHWKLDLRFCCCCFPGLSLVDGGWWLVAGDATLT